MVASVFGSVYRTQQILGSVGARKVGRPGRSGGGGEFSQRTQTWRVGRPSALFRARPQLGVAWHGVAWHWASVSSCAERQSRMCPKTETPCSKDRAGLRVHLMITQALAGSCVLTVGLWENGAGKMHVLGPEKLTLTPLEAATKFRLSKSGPRSGYGPNCMLLHTQPIIHLINQHG